MLKSIAENHKAAADRDLYSGLIRLRAPPCGGGPKLRLGNDRGTGATWPSDQPDSQYQPGRFTVARHVSRGQKAGARVETRGADGDDDERRDDDVADDCDTRSNRAGRVGECQEGNCDGDLIEVAGDLKAGDLGFAGRIMKSAK